MNGVYEIVGLPNGDYVIRFTLLGLTTLDASATVPLSGTIVANAAMQVGSVAEAVQVTAVIPTPLTSTAISSNIRASEVAALPVGRTVFRVAELAPGLTANTPNNGQLAINGAFAYDNIFLIDGVDVNDNLFDTSNNLFIEDAVEKAQVLTSGISAEYGRFSGGVVNVVIKSGGNQFSGSFSRDPATLINRTLPNDVMVATYRGVVSNSLFVEGQVSGREFGFRDTGGTSTDIFDSPFITVTQGLGHFNAPYFDSTDPEDRNNRQVTGSATYFLSTNAGTHSIKGGFEDFRSTNTGGNSQSSTGYVFYTEYLENAGGAPLLDSAGRFTPLFGSPSGLTEIEDWLPVRGARLDINTLSFYVNDSWAVNNKLSLNLGIRAEKVSSEATGGIVGIDTSSVTPRLAVAFDPLGNGQMSFQATYSHYSGKYGESQFAANTNVGTPNAVFGFYTGPDGQGRDFAPGFDPANYETYAGDFPIQNICFDDNLKSPLTKESTLSAGGAIGPRGYAKVTYINRRASDFVEDFGTVDLGAILRVDSGRAYSLRADGVRPNATHLGIIAAAGYVDTPGRRDIYFSQGRGSETFDGYGLLDVSVNYSIPVWDSLSPWIKFDLFNALHNDKQIYGNTTVWLDPDSPLDEFGIRW